MRGRRLISLIQILCFSFLVSSVSGGWRDLFWKKEGTTSESSASVIDTSPTPVVGVPILDHQTVVHQRPTSVTRVASAKLYRKPTSSASTPSTVAEGGVKTNKKSKVKVRATPVGWGGSVKTQQEEAIKNDQANSLISISGNIRDFSTLKLTDILIATDIEGGLHGIDRASGNLLWSLDHPQLPPLLQVRHPSSIINETLIVEPYGDGNLFYFNPYQGLQKLPVSIKHLIDASPLSIKSKIVVDDLGTVIEDEKMYTGSRKTDLYTIDATTGDIISAFGPGTDNKVYIKDKVDCTDHLGSNECENIVIIGKTNYELTIHSNEQTLYNVEYSQWQQNTLVNHLASQNLVSRDGVYIAPFKDKSLVAIDTDFNLAKWVCPNLPAIVNNVFDIYIDYTTEEKVLLPHPHQAAEDVKNLDESNLQVYVDMTEEGTWFALSSDYFSSLVDAAPTSKFEMNSRWRQPEIFQDPLLLRMSIVGVHNLNPLQYRKVLINNEPFETVPSLPSGPNSNNLPALPSVPPSDDLSRSIGKYISPEELHRIQEQLARSMIEEQNSLVHKISSFIVRVIESGLMMVLALFLFYLLSTFKVIPPLHVVLTELGILPRAQIPPQEVKIDTATTQDISSKNGTELAEEKLAGVQEIMPTGNDAKNLEMNNEATPETYEDKKKRKRGSRGGKKNKKTTGSDDDGSMLDLKDFEQEGYLKHLSISNKVLGYGSSGTVVFQGKFQNRPVAVKRLLIDFYDVASKEIQLLSESDDHPNVIRYYFSESTEKFMYIAVELCSASLENVIEGTKGTTLTKSLSIQKNIDPINVLFQITSGVNHLHSMKIVHRDLKPQNILIAPPKRYASLSDSKNKFRVLISDFGLCKKLEIDESSFRTNNVNNPTGTSGWRAPEIISGKVSLSDSYVSEPSTASNSNDFMAHDVDNLDLSTRKRLTRAIDIFSLGCIFYYVLSKGDHPFGDRILREANILKDEYQLNGINASIKERSVCIEATDLIRSMISQNPLLRPTSTQILKHPFFWGISKKLEFLLKVSDRFEVERRDPPSPLLLKLEEVSTKVITNGDWTMKFDAVFMDNLGKYRKYKGEKLMDLLRALRNKYHHFRDLPDELAEVMGPIPDGFYKYFIQRFPNILMEIYYVVHRNLKDDQVLSEFF
ncbi:unnamed protein product [Kluyveromyces dobzhanskii CBS 2104]|uniref:non-specific serine/threonine protein kinase n=1 Tax=Kluyveromyces dobzhanskii CBS 2104 TaxID=1427455 RepID=A0A0A8L490_9SACH|nr:unnamed protein product [Kluyveromyces dobzhanskii CBS 2104]